MPAHLDLADYGGLLLATRLRRLSDLLFAGVDKVYAAHGVQVTARCVPILLLLRDNGPTSITDVARQLGQSHPAVSQMSRTLAAAGLIVDRADSGDERRRLLALSRKADALMARLADTWSAVVGAVDDLGAVVSTDLPELVRGVEVALSARSFDVRIRDRHRASQGSGVEIIPYEPRYRADFKRLNIEWLEKYFRVEAIDEEVLSDPEATVLASGGQILLARYHGAIVGTCALIRAGRARVELSKMAVTARCQGHGIGRRLLGAAIERFRTMKARTLFLESNSRLTPALTLYESCGFRHAPRPKMDSHYERSDVYMVFEPEAGHAPASRPRRTRARRTPAKRTKR